MLLPAENFRKFACCFFRHPATELYVNFDFDSDLYLIEIFRIIEICFSLFERKPSMLVVFSIYIFHSM